MITYIKAHRTSVALFGEGTIRISVTPNKAAPGGKIWLSPCQETIIGQEPPPSKKKKVDSSIVLSFSKTESIDVLIAQLESLKEEMENASGSTSKDT